MAVRMNAGGVELAEWQIGVLADRLMLDPSELQLRRQRACECARKIQLGRMAVSRLEIPGKVIGAFMNDAAHYEAVLQAQQSLQETGFSPEFDQLVEQAASYM